MKKLIGIALVLALAVMLVPGAAFAWDPVVTTTNWLGTGLVTETVVAGNDATSKFTTDGAAIAGTFTSTYTENTGYPYMEVNAFLGKINADVGNGYIEFSTNRTDSYEGSYGNSGQKSYNFVGVSGGVGEMTMDSGTNYASLQDYAYWDRTSNGYHFEANATNYTLIKSLQMGLALTDDSVGAKLTGSGIGQMECMDAKTWMDSSSTSSDCRLGSWFYSYGMKANAVGSGDFDLQAYGHDSVSLRDVTSTGATGGSTNANGVISTVGTGVKWTGDGSANSAWVNQHWDFNTNFNMPDWSIDAK